MIISHQREIGDYSIAVEVTNGSHTRKLGVLQNGDVQTQVVLEPGERKEVVLEVKNGVRDAVLADVQNWEKGAK